MAEIDAEVLAQQAVLLGLVTKEEAKQAKADADDGSLDAIARSFLRKELLTRWQVDKLQKDDPSGFFYGGCKVLFHIAEGTFARVYRGKKMPGGQPVAIKVLRNRFGSDPEAIRRFNEEAEAGLRLIHPNIVRIYEYGEEDKKFFMVMEYVEGSNLRDFLKLRSRLGETESLPLMVGLASALKFANEQGITHRDIKGTNILIANNGTAKLVDFGLATIEGDEKKMAVAHGQRTVDYSALERSCNAPKGDPRSDIFFLGCVFYQMLTGQLPLPEVETHDPLAKMLKRGINSIKPLSEHANAPHAELTRIIEKMMKVDLKARYQSFGEVVHDLDAYLSSLAAPGARPRRSMAKLVDAEPGTDVPRSARHDGQKTILCVEFQEEIQEAFRKTLNKMGYRVFLVANAETAAERYREDPPDAVVFDLDGLGPDALEAFLDMHEAAHAEGHDLAALVLLGPRQHYLAKNLPTDARLVVLPKPIKMKQVQDAIARLVPVKV
jgi:CheY-like chemotaxis protein